jgi:hypothetical protein
MAEEEVLEEEEEFDFEDWLSQGVRAMKRMKWGKRRKHVQAKHKEHMRAASKEVLLAFRSLLDEAIEQFEPEPTRKGKPDEEAG